MKSVTYTYVPLNGGKVYGARSLLCEGGIEPYVITLDKIPPTCSCLGNAFLVDQTGGRRVCKHLRYLLEVSSITHKEEYTSSGDKENATKLRIKQAKNKVELLWMK